MRTGPVRPGDVQGPPRVEALPSLDIDEQGLTKEMRMARMLSEESLNLARTRVAERTNRGRHPALERGHTGAVARTQARASGGCAG